MDGWMDFAISVNGNCPALRIKISSRWLLAHAQSINIAIILLLRREKKQILSLN